MFDVYSDAFALSSVHAGENPLERQNQDYFRSHRYSNSVIFQGPHRIYVPFSNEYWGLVQGKGHWGADALPGDAGPRQGVATTFESARGKVTSAEMIRAIK